MSVRYILGATFGHLYISGAETVALTTANVGLPVKPYTEGLAKNMTLDGTNGTITVSTGGQYRIEIGGSLNADKNATLHGDVHINGVHQESIEFERAVSAAGAIGDASAWGILQLTAGDVITYEIDSTFLNTTVTFAHAQLTVERLGQ